MSDLTSTKIDFLKKLGTQNISHSGGTLLEHLIGVSEILKDMDAPQHVQDAGLYHLSMAQPCFIIKLQQIGVWYRVLLVKTLSILRTYFAFLEERQIEKQRYQ